MVRGFYLFTMQTNFYSDEFFSSQSRLREGDDMQDVGSVQL